MPSRLRLAALALAFLAVVAALGVIAHRTEKVVGKPVFTVGAVPGSDGVKLSAHVFLPTASGRHPLAIMPASWGSDAEEYRIVGQRLADRGYVVVAYAQRGFGASGGLIDFAGKATQADLSSVIDWSLKNTPARSDAIASVGVSYGAGMSLLAAEHDPRIKVVVAMSTWTDLDSAYFPNGTPNATAIKSLFGPGRLSKISPELASFTAPFLSGDFSAARNALAKLSPERSPMTDVAALNKNKTAVMIANDFQDSYFSPSQLIPFFDKLTGPKRLELAPGDHGAQEAPGLLGKPTKVWSDVTAWLDRYLRGVALPSQDSSPIQVQDAATGQWHALTSWPATNTPLYLGRATDGSGTLSAAPDTTALQTITTGSDTVAQSAPIEIGVNPYLAPHGVKLNAVSHSSAGVWTGASTTSAVSILGAAQVQLTITGATADRSVFTYLYDTSPDGDGALIAAAPYSLTATGGSVEISLPPIAWTVAAGHHLTLVIDTVDAKFGLSSQSSTSLTLGSSAAEPARLLVPTS